MAFRLPEGDPQGAVDDAVTARKAAITNLQRGNIQHFKLQYRTRKKQDHVGWSLYLEKANVFRKRDQLFIFTTMLGEMKYASTKQLHKLLTGKGEDPKVHPPMDCKLQKDRYGDYYLLISVPRVDAKQKPVGSAGGVASMDPGVRKWMTIYSPDQQEALMIAPGFMKSMWPYLYRLDKLVSESAQSAGKKKHKLELSIRKLRKLIFHRKRELMYQTANLLTEKYDTLLVPKLDTIGLVSSSTKNLKTKGFCREVMNTCHATFHNHLKFKCREKGGTFMEVKEHFTSQTCHQCGTLTKTSSEGKCCSKCHYQGDRDIIGALNILLKAVRCEKPLA